jgi:hypothetical protein
MLSLANMKVGMADKVAQQVIDIFIRESEILELLPFDNAVSPTGGSTLVYGYVQEKLPSTAAFRAIGDEYVSNEATIQQLSVILKPFGGSFQVDRIIKSIEAQLESLDHQVRSKVKAAVGLFHDTMINGDTAVNSKAFDGLNKMLVGSSTEYNTSTFIDLSTMTNLKNNADVFYEALLKLINTTNADAIMVNETMKTKIQTIARVLGYKTESEMAFGRVVTTIGENGVRIIDLKNTYSVSQAGVVSETPIIGTKTRRVGATDEYIKTTDTAIVAGKTYYTKAAEVYTAVETPAVADIATYYEKVKIEVTGLTDIYAAKFDVYDGFHGATVTGNKVIESFLPDFTQPGAVKTGEIEMVAAVALKNSRNAGVLRNLKIV